jgi:hypothetical protein
LDDESLCAEAETCKRTRPTDNSAVREARRLDRHAHIERRAVVSPDVGRLNKLRSIGRPAYGPKSGRGARHASGTTTVASISTRASGSTRRVTSITAMAGNAFLVVLQVGCADKAELGDGAAVSSAFRSPRRDVVAPGNGPCRRRISNGYNFWECALA